MVGRAQHAAQLQMRSVDRRSGNDAVIIFGETLCEDEALAAAHVQPRGVRLIVPSLEDVFISRLASAQKATVS